MSQDVSKSGIVEIPLQILEKFIAELRRADVPDAVVGRLREALVEDRTLSEATIRAALFTSDQVT
jgi:hypothetical protein